MKSFFTKNVWRGWYNRGPLTQHVRWILHEIKTSF